MWEVVREMRKLSLEARLKVPRKQKPLSLEHALKTLKRKAKTSDESETESPKGVTPRFTNVVLEVYERSKQFRELLESSASYTPPIIEAYKDDYKAEPKVDNKQEKMFDYDKLEDIQKEAKLANLELTPWKATEDAFKLNHYDEYEMWKLLTPGGQLLAFIAYELA